MKTPDALAGELAEEMSELVRSEIDLALARRGPELRVLGIELGWAVAAGTAGLLAVAALSWSAVRVLDLMVRPWVAPLIVAAGWACLGALTFWPKSPRHLFARLATDGSTSTLIAAEHRTDAAKEAVRVTAERLAIAMAHETAERAVVDRASATAHEVDVLVRDIVSMLAAPGRVLVSRFGGPPH